MSRAPAYEVLHGRMVQTPEPDVRPIPPLEDFARFLFDRDGADAPEAAHSQRRLLIEYASIWAAYEGTSVAAAVRQAHELADEQQHVAADEEPSLSVQQEIGKREGRIL